MKVTDKENHLVWLLRDFMDQNLKEDPPGSDLFNSGFIRINRQVLECLCEYGHMEKIEADEFGGRWFRARLLKPEQTPNAFGRDVEVRQLFSPRRDAI